MAGARSTVMVRRRAAFSESPVPVSRRVLAATFHPSVCHMNQIAGFPVNDKS